MALVIVTPPVVEPVTVAQVKEELRLEISDDDAYIARLIRSCRALCETFTRRAFITQTLRHTSDSWPGGNILGGFPAAFFLPRPKLQSVSSITYVDTDGTTQTLSSSLYQVDTDSEPGRVGPAYGEVWPFARRQMNTVKVTYVAGYGSEATDVPEGIKDVIRLFAAWRYETRNLADSIPDVYKQLLLPYKSVAPWN